MTAETTRRGFLQGLLGAVVICALPKEVQALARDDFDPFSITAPDGWTYQWVRTAVMGEKDERALEARLLNKWTFVKPLMYPQAPVGTLRHAIESHGLVLMEKSTVLVEADERKRRITGSCSIGNHAWLLTSKGRKCHWCGQIQERYADYIPEDPDFQDRRFWDWASGKSGG